MDASSRELGRLKIDKEIQDAVELLCRLRSRRNTLAPISLLPTEILSRIFTTIAHSTTIAYSRYTSRSAVKAWIRPVTAVCSHWRAVALACPTLWCFIDFSLPSLTVEMLKRSKKSPLIIDAILIPETVDGVHLALQHISRVRKLRLIVSKAIDMKQLICRIDNRAPLLQSLHLSIYKDSNNDYTVPGWLFDSHHLRRVGLVGCNIPWDSPLLRGLVHLRVRSIASRRARVARPSIKQLLEALERMPLLETLDLEES